ncbi:hypothetical protein BCR35DRAFT_314946 [Leucosporidium creatinivorum]|uniref:NAD(P)-binding domain-containing protein n=1 Tax=Leucosporidium creatinivorum TaxID=106004 RepID=A0A1Y2EQ46_9BASI|nr:hypothetical protein BCR35DRAFT_314946 [Leucosporidium creatinivorum]
MSYTQAPVAFFGATGGCALACLVRTLNAGIDSRALVRTPQKLLDLLAARGVSSAKIEKHLVLLQGNALDVEAVKQVFTVEVSLVIFGIGGAPAFSPNPLRLFLTLDQPEICGKAMTTVLAALSTTPCRPPIACISTTGLRSPARDVPLLLVPLYHWLLAIPHKDKQRMEDVLLESGREWVIVKPSLLQDGEGKGKVTRVGWEGEGGKPAVGTFINRKSVGEWLFEEVVQVQKREQWVGRKVTLTW